MAEFDAFIAAPSEEALERCTKEQLIKLADHYSVDVGDRKLKGEIKVALKVKLLELGIFRSVPVPLAPPAVSLPVQAQGLTFEQQKELLLLQMEHDKIKFEMEAKKQLELEVIHQQTEKMKLELGYRQSLEQGTHDLQSSKLSDIHVDKFGSRDCGFAVEEASTHIFQDGYQTKDPCGDPHIYHYLQQAMQQQGLQHPDSWQARLLEMANCYATKKKKTTLDRKSPPETRQAKLKMEEAKAKEASATSARTDTLDILTAINSLRAVVTTQNDKLLAAISEIKTDLSSYSGRLMEAEERIGETEDNMTALQQKVQGMDKLVTTLTEKIDDLENHHRRSNLHIVGPRGHKRDKVRVMRAARAKGKIMHGVQHVMFFPDFLVEVTRMRMRYSTIKQQLRARGIQFGLLFPAKLFTLHNGRGRVFGSPEDVETFLREEENNKAD
ncbi:hypothetical protein ABVT39_026844 [Epinephelus coioides]